ncbi:MAG: cyclic 2,3-diphosphoglycerate synthase [Acidobacteriota bacterium]|nr:cyclic 2,3-diphosphoglycerate synthase [Acidobacteriota bacterium]
MGARKVVILGAAGRDFHNFNVFYRDNPDYHVVAFTATQIPDITGRRYPPDLAGGLYDNGIPILPEGRLEDLIREHYIDEVVFAYSDVSHEHVMHLASRVVAAGADFTLLGASSTMLVSSVKVVSVCAARTGAGKSQTTCRVASILRERGFRVVAVRHPMPYGDLEKQRVQRFATTDDLDRHDCTIEEREEYEPHIAAGTVVYAGVDYGAILVEAEREADVILWDGGNNDLPFIKPDLEIVVVDPHRPGHEKRYYPGEANVRRADVVVINKVGTATEEGLAEVRENIGDLNPSAIVVEADSPITVSDPDAISGKKVLVIEDGPTLTHGEMAYGAGAVAARQYGAAELVDPRPYAVGSIAETFAKYPQTEYVLPAMGYGDEQVRELEATVRATPCDLVLVGTPIDLRRLIEFDKPALRVTYDLAERGKPDLADLLGDLLAEGDDGA